MRRCSWERVQLREQHVHRPTVTPSGAETESEKGPAHLRTGHRSSRRQTFLSPFLEQGWRGVRRGRGLTLPLLGL